MKLPSFFNNKYFYYFLLALEIMQLLTYFVEKKYKCMFIVLCITYTMVCKFNNKSLAILTAMFVSSLFSQCNPLDEGFTTASPTNCCSRGRLKADLNDVELSNCRTASRGNIPQYCS